MGESYWLFSERAHHHLNTLFPFYRHVLSSRQEQKTHINQQLTTTKFNDFWRLNIDRKWEFFFDFFFRMSPDIIKY